MMIEKIIRFILKIEDKKIQIEILWCFLGGLGFVVLSALFRSATKNNVLDEVFKLDRFNPIRAIFRDDDNIIEFIFGFIITGIIIWSIKTYKKL